MYLRQASDLFFRPESSGHLSVIKKVGHVVIITFLMGQGNTIFYCPIYTISSDRRAPSPCMTLNNVQSSTVYDMIACHYLLCHLPHISLCIMIG